MKLISKPISKQEIIKYHNTFFETMIKAVVDIEKEIIAIDAELHADLEAHLLEKGSDQKDLWGINLYLQQKKENRLEYTALINIRPAQNNPDMEIQSEDIKNKINKIVNKLILEK
ncbi:MAG: hypothetical protein KGY74_08905 [Candidatus Cloacimonetes bacterium]|nr:hypothetical protein [Candidatus Cloacimonadota bacterium]